MSSDFATILAAATAADPADRNAGLYHAWHRLDDLLEKLKLLDYERQLLRPMQLQPLQRHYFASVHNTGEQFFVFQSLCAWLVRCTGRDFEQPQEFHDPSQTIARLVRTLHELHISTDFPTSALMRGSGLVCAHVLDALATQALGVQRGARLGRPNVRVEAEAPDGGDDGEQAMADDENEIILERLEEEHLMAMHSDDDENEDNDDTNVLGGEGNVLDLRPSRSNGAAANGVAAAATMTSAMDTESWRLELERVLPQLKVVVRTDARDWRAHWEQMRTLKNGINSLSVDTLAQLQRLRTDITHASDKIASRENHLNTNLAPLIAQHRAAAVEASELRTALVDIDAAKAALEQQSLRLDEDFVAVRAQMEQRGTAMSDGTPLINIKKAAQRVRDELVEMELEIAVLRHTCDQEVLKQNAMYAELASEMASSSVALADGEL